MPRMIGSLTTLSLPVSAMITDLDKRFRKLNREGVKAWVGTAAAIIPNWSGMSRATLKELAGRVGVQVAAFPAPGPSGRIPPNRVSDGEAQSQSGLIEKLGNYGYFYRSNVFHLAVNENVDATKFGFRLVRPGPYNFRQQADLAYLDTVNQGLRNFDPQILKFLKVRRQRIG